MPQTPDSRKPGRPPLPASERASRHLILRVTQARMDAYKGAARKRKRPDGTTDTLSSWCFEHLDKASGYQEPE